MRRDKLRYFVYAVLGCFALIMTGGVLLWVMDNIFNGVLKEFFISFIDGMDNITGAYLLNGSRLATTALTVIVIVSALISATGAVCAYGAYKKQHALLLASQQEAAAAKALAETEMQRKSDLITYLAHDLKTPLASVIAYLSLLDEAPELTREQRAKYTGVALDKAQRLEQLINELFEIIRFNLQTISLNREKLDLKLMLEQLADEFYPILLPMGKSISIDCQGTPVITGDSDKLARVFNNILKNAAAYSREDTVISITAQSNTDGVVVEFANQGNPIPPEKLELIFRKFYRLDTSRSTRSGGAGLGLAIAKEIVEAHGGTISAASDAGGTVFRVELPYSNDGQAAMPDYPR